MKYLNTVTVQIRLPKPHSNSMENSFMYDGASTWNSVPEINRDN